MRTEYCGLLDQSYIGKQVTLCGWVNRHRNLGSIIFVDMRDHKGIVQIIFNKKKIDIFKLASELRNEFCIRVKGIVHARNKKNINVEINTGDIEVLVNKLTIINRSEPLPIDFNQENSEESRLKYRYLDLRRPEIAERFRVRDRVKKFVRNFMNKHDFLDIETPILTKSTLEGARDYLVPSRIQKGKFYALPQSPQLFKQLLMISGFDRYYQIVKCFRDEDLRSDRQPEFTQIDLETSFMKEDQVRNLMEKLICDLWGEIKGFKLNRFPVMTFSEANRRFGSDKPDLRNLMELIDIDDIINTIKFPIFRNSINKESLHNRIAALCVKNTSFLSIEKITEYEDFIKQYGLKNLFFIRINNQISGIDGINSPIKHFLNEEFIKDLLKRTKAQDGDIIFFCADTKKIVTESLGALRVKIGNDLHLMNNVKWAPLWIVDFPMFKYDEEGKFKSMHHPFTSPKNMTVNELKKNPEKAVSYTYDMVINGCEIGSGSVRIHSKEMQKTVFNILGISEQEQQEKFGFLLHALQFGAPPHAGFAFGLDRLTMFLTETNNIRDVIAFPKSITASCIMTESPSFIKETSLADLNIRIIKK